MIKKRFAIMISTLVIIMLMMTSIFAKTGDESIKINYFHIKILLDGQEITPADALGNGIEPFAYNDTTYLPIRAISNALNKAVEWDGFTNTIFISDNNSDIPVSGNQVVKPADTDYATIQKDVTVSYKNITIVVNGEIVEPKDANGNSVEPFVYNDTTYLPVRAVGEAVGKEVTWDEQSAAVYLGIPPEINVDTEAEASAEAEISVP